MIPKTRKSPAGKRKLWKSAIALFQAILLSFTLSTFAFAAETTETVEDEQSATNLEENYIFEPIGAKKMLLKAGEEFVDPGAVLLDENRNLLYMFFVYSDEVTILDTEGKRHPELESYCTVSGKVATETEGEYLRKITYKDKTAERLITVLENPEEGLYKPEGDVELFFTLKPKGDSEHMIKSGTQFKDPGVEVYDQFWIRHPELEKEVKTIGTVDTKQVKYYLWQYDLKGETINCIIRVVGQKGALALRLIDKKEVSTIAGQTFEIKGAMVYTQGGIRRSDLDKEIVVRGTVNTLKPGDYILIFDLDGVTITQLVHVTKPTTNSGSNGTSSTWNDRNDSSEGKPDNPSPGPSTDPNPGPDTDPNPGPGTDPNPGPGTEEPEDPPPAGEEEPGFGGEGSERPVEPPQTEDPPPAGEEEPGFGGN